MSIIEILILGVALSMDAFAVTISNSIAHPHLSLGRRLTPPLFFGLFQGLMPLIGFFVGSLAASYIDAFAGPLALVILAVIGGKMVYESIKELRAQRKETVGAEQNAAAEIAGDALQDSGAGKEKTLSLPSIALQAVATSIDALIVGVSFATLRVDIFVAAPLIALTTFLICVIGLIIGKRVGLLLGDRAQLIGGLVLIAIGIKVCFF